MSKYIPYLSPKRREIVDRMVLGQKCKIMSPLFVSYSLYLNGITSPCFETSHFGKPFLLNYSGIFFNVSYSDDLIVVALSEREVGVDIERSGKIGFEVAKKFFSPHEVFLVSKNKNPDASSSRIWTLKESMIKNIGKGLTIPLNAFSIDFREDKTQQKCTYDGKNYFFFEYCFKNYYIPLCLSHKNSFPSEITIVNVGDIRKYICNHLFISNVN